MAASQVVICCRLRDKKDGMLVDFHPTESLEDVVERVAERLGSTYPGKLVKIVDGNHFPVDNVRYLKDEKVYVYDPKTVDLTASTTDGSAIRIKQEEPTQQEISTTARQEDEKVESSKEQEDDGDGKEPPGNCMVRTNKSIDEESYAPSEGAIEEASNNASHCEEKGMKRGVRKAAQQAAKRTAFALEEEIDPKLKERFFLLWEEDCKEYPVRVVSIDREKRTCTVKWERFGGQYDEPVKGVSFTRLLQYTDERRERFNAWYYKCQKEYNSERQARLRQEKETKKRQKEEQRKERKRLKKQREADWKQQQDHLYAPRTRRDNVRKLTASEHSEGSVLQQFDRLVYFSYDDETVEDISSKSGVPVDKILYDNNQDVLSDLTKTKKLYPCTAIVLPKVWDGKDVYREM